MVLRYLSRPAPSRKACYTHAVAAANLPSSAALVRLGRLAFILLSLLALLVLLVVTLGQYLTNEEVRLPNVVGLDAAQAELELERFDITVRTYTEVIPGLAVNAVTAQNPQAGALVRRGRTVALGVNTPTSEVEMPLLTGATRAQAVRALSDLGLELGELAFEFSGAPEGEVIGQTPAAGQVLSTGSRANITVSRGSEVATLSMPQVVGLSVEGAEARLRSAGFRSIDRRPVAVSSTRPNIVSEQLPPAGQEVSLSNRVVLGVTLPARTVVKVPELIGIPLAEAQTTLARAGLSLGAIIYVTDEARPPGIVSFAPASHTLRGSPVEVVINRAGLTEPVSDIQTPSGYTPSFPGGPDFGPQTPSSQDRPLSSGADGTTGNVTTAPRLESAVRADGGRLIPFNFDPVAHGISLQPGQALKLRVEVEDERGERVLFERNLQAGQVAQADLSVYGEATLSTYLNEILFQRWNPL